MSHSNNTAIVFVHGLLGFSSYSILGKEIQYFRSLRRHLKNSPQQIFFPTLPPNRVIEDRAQVLANFLSGINADRIDLIAHSMGGLDSRYLIQHFDPMHRVRSLTTLATPHYGSPLAKWSIERSNMFFRLMYRMATPAVYDLTPKSCTQFNKEIGNRKGVSYTSYASARPVADMPLPLRPWTRMIAADCGDNDSMVSVASAQWGAFKGTLQADHFELAGWSIAWPNARKARPFNYIQFYLDLIRKLAINQ
jgi:triacylglycerol lipase